MVVGIDIDLVIAMSCARGMEKKANVFLGCGFVGLAETIYT